MKINSILYEKESSKLLVTIANEKEGITYKKQLESQTLDDFYNVLKSVCESEKMPCFSIEVHCFCKEGEK